MSAASGPVPVMGRAAATTDGFSCDHCHFEGRWLACTRCPKQLSPVQAAEPGLAGLHRFVARFHADDGLAELRTLVLDTPNVIAAGR
jgi:hypothetical protein